ncbi:lipopolysaccharide assembly protein LapB [Sporosarcina pasteurii]|uniref:TPR repeat-containing protein yrrB n=1 Tax=Sporosarcina pasteurii TaxID=1474 RepID=A0A380BP52_SPOPA|nr:tetratricopeptide repeat protein [Sporosarcina pasteurii]MDS9470981.1 tetratricopeptide repeat protein [Sporosarcina pasteurii]QBQ05369.1 tetratricopeptide repeat protein [Sporosarcina pasteurii]SUJ03578.1 TPR repeat-containing protein yrrB [Sporosarcina pasteurii]
MDHNEKGIIALQNEQYEKAIESFLKAIEEKPEEAVGYINVGNVFASIGDTEKAEPFFQKAITLDEEAGTAIYGLANLYYNEERYEEASKLYEQAIRKGIEEADAYFMLGKSLERAGKVKLALPYLQRAAELAPTDMEVRLSYGILLANLELFDQAGEEFRYVVEHDEENADAHYNLGFLYAVSTDRKEDALKHLKQAFTLNPEYEQARYIYDMIQLDES